MHFVVPGGAPRKDGSRWEATPANFLFPHAALVQDYRRFFRTALEQAGLDQLVPPHVWEDDWVVDIRPVGDGQAVLKYLAPYVHRVAIGDNRILDCSEQTVTYRVTPSGSKTSTTRTVSGEQFVRGFAQHVLPKGFQKVRYYGWMAGSSRFRPEALRWLVWLHLGWTYWLGSGVAP